MATAATGFFGDAVGTARHSVRHLCGMAVGLVNGLGVAYLRAPSMIFTLGINAVAQGLMVYHTGGFAPQDQATPLMRELRRRPAHSRRSQPGPDLARRSASRRSSC